MLGVSQSRNYRLGHELAHGQIAHDALSSQSTVAEGAATAPVAVELATRLRVDLPIAQSVVARCATTAPRVELVALLMGRGSKTELAGLDTPLTI